MAIFNSGSDPAGLSSATTIIANGTTIKGDIQLKCNLHIDGEIEGAVETIGNVVIGKSGMAKGDIVAKRVSISGRFEGSVNGDSVEVLEGGKLFGKVISKGFVIEPNGVFEGESRLKVEQAQSAAESSPNADVAEARMEKKDAKLTAV